jgi:tetratricopeptide (TPR) repeat protein
LIATALFVLDQAFGWITQNGALRHAVRREDARRARRALVRMGRYVPRPAPPESIARLRVNESVVLGLEGGAAEAVALLEQIDRDSLPGHLSWLIVNNQAWYLCEAGRAPEALEPASQAAFATRQEDPALRASCLGTLGRVLVDLGRFAEAVPVLEQALAAGGDYRSQAIRAFLLGQALRAVGRVEAARDAYHRVVHLAPRLGCPGARAAGNARCCLSLPVNQRLDL